MTDVEHPAPSPPWVALLDDRHGLGAPFSKQGLLGFQWRGYPRLRLCFCVEETDDLLTLDEGTAVVTVRAVAELAPRVGRIHPSPDGGIVYAEDPGDLGRLVDGRLADIGW